MDRDIFLDAGRRGDGRVGGWWQREYKVKSYVLQWQRLTLSLRHHWEESEWWARGLKELVHREDW